jgi:predicted ATPase/DNA-binding CsgD family transcriptional regulator
MAGDRIADNISLQLTSFIGREQEIAAIAHLLAHTRLISLIGAGGIGKSRLALEVARRSAETFPDGLWFVEFASLSDETLLYSTLASALDVQEEKNVPLVTTVCTFLAAKKALLILDNCEHLVAACAVCVETLLHACPTLSLLVTSREALNIGAETLFLVPPLLFPPHEEMVQLTAARQFEAVTLFLARARSIQLHFTLTPANFEAVVQVCRAVDGIPLALELAAARLRIMPIEQIAIRLTEQPGAHLHLLSQGMRTAPSRQQTLRATLDWSYALLSPREQRLLQRVALFAGGWTLEAAEAVCADAEIPQEEILDLLGQLVNKSLVVVSEESTLTEAGEVASLHARYRLLETVRQYTYEKLQDGGEEQELQKRHIAYFLFLAQQADAILRGRKQRIWLHRLDCERDNLRAALTYALHIPAAQHGLQLASALAWYWIMRTSFSEGGLWLQEMLSLVRDEDPHIRATALYRAGIVAWFRSDFQHLADYSEQSLALFSLLNDTRGIGCSLSNLVELTRWRGDYSSALQLGEQALVALQEAEDTWTIAFTHLPLMVIQRQQGNTSEALLLGKKAMALFRVLGDNWGLAIVLHLLGLTFSNAGDSAQATLYLQESIHLFQSFGDTNGKAGALHALGINLFRQGRQAEARCVLEECKELLNERGNVRFVAQVLLDEGQMNVQQSSYECAISCFKECLVLSQQNEDLRRTGTALYFLGVIALQQGKSYDAASLLQESLAALSQDGNKILLIDCIEALALLMAQKRVQSGEAQQVVRWLGSVHSMRETIGAPSPALLRPLYEEVIAMLDTMLDEGAFQAAFQQGQTLTREQVVEDMRFSDIAERISTTAQPIALTALRERQSSSSETLLESLTNRELEVLRLIAVGQSNAHVAQTLSISSGTVKTHLNSIYSKFAVKSRTAAIHYARERRIL